MDGHVIAPGELRADGYGDVRRIQASRGHLVEQRLEEMMVALIDEDDAHGVAPGKPLRCGETAEPASHDDRRLSHVGSDATATYLLGPVPVPAYKTACSCSSPDRSRPAKMSHIVAVYTPLTASLH